MRFWTILVSLALSCGLTVALGSCDGCTPLAGANDGVGDGGAGGEGEGEGEGQVIPGLLALQSVPANVSLTTDGTTRPEQAFTVTAVLDGGSEDATDRVAFSLSDDTIGTMRGNTFVSSAIGGAVDVIARAGNVEARARVTVRVRTVLVGDGNGSASAGDIPPNAADLFDDATIPVDASRAPDLVYPNDGVLLPRNLGVIEVQWRRGGAANTLFAVTFSSPVMEARVITRCVDLNGGCVYTPSLSMWRLLADTHAGADAVTVTVQGTDDTGTAIGRSNSLTMSFSATDVRGGLYYWTTSQGTGIMRVDFGAVEQVPEKFFPFTGNECYGCHALSPDGRKMSLSRRGIGQGQLGLINIVDGQETLGFTDTQREQFQSWNGSSTLFAGIFGDTNDLAVRHQLRIHDGDDGGVVERINLDHEPGHPDWSPVEDRLNYTKVTHHSSSQRPGRGGINSMVKRDGAWTAPQELVPPETGKNRYSPSTAPAGEYLAYVESRCNAADQVYSGECDGDADQSARLFAFAHRTSTSVELARANAPGRTDGGGNLSNTFPKWAPFEGPRLRDGSGRVNWMTFSSRRNYGLRTGNPDSGNQLLWMVAVDPDGVIAGSDGSFPAFALPFQDISTSNHMAQWTREFVAIGCTELGTSCDPADDNACCGAAVCRDDGTGVGTCEADDGSGGDVCAAIGQSCVRLPCCDALLCLTVNDQQVCGQIGG